MTTKRKSKRARTKASRKKNWAKGKTTRTKKKDRGVLPLAPSDREVAVEDSLTVDEASVVDAVPEPEPVVEKRRWFRH
jgi:hypothetical protein